MIKFEGYEIYAVNTKGLWYCLVFKDGKGVHSGKIGYTYREGAITEGKLKISLETI